MNNEFSIKLFKDLGDNDCFSNNFKKLPEQILAVQALNSGILHPNTFCSRWIYKKEQLLINEEEKTLWNTTLRFVSEDQKVIVWERRVK